MQSSDNATAVKGDLRVRTMSLDDLRVAADWAAEEGWNPGHEDAEAFHSVDPDGFLMGWLGDQPVSAISVVRHSDDFGFLGFYLCHPDHRGKGYGWATWQAGMARLGKRSVGLDGVPAQQANYERSGFRLVYNTQRYAGPITGQANKDCAPAKDGDAQTLLSLDHRINDQERSAYLKAWTTQTETRRTLVHRVGNQITGFGTIRACRHGHKIGPVFAPDPKTAQRLILALVAEVSASEVMIDVPDPNQGGVDLVRSMGLEPVFACARMYTGDVPQQRMDQIFGLVSFELG